MASSLQQAPQPPRMEALSKEPVMSRSTLVVVALVTTACFAFGCSSSDKEPAKKPASGQAATSTTRKPAVTPAPKQSVAPNVGANQSKSLKTDAECTPADEGKGACVDEFVVFCSGGSLYALDCSASFGGTCGDNGTQVDCLVEESAGK